MNTSTNAGNERELYLQLINSKSTITPKPQHLQMIKRHTIALSRSNHQQQQGTNLTVEVQYMSILNKVRKLLEHNHYPIFERDYRKDRTESALAMHALVSNSFYWYLECDFFYYYRVEYAFHNCPFEADIRAMLRYTPFDTRAKEVNVQPDYLTFYKSVLRAQDRKYITY